MRVVAVLMMMVMVVVVVVVGGGSGASPPPPPLRSLLSPKGAPPPLRSLTQRLHQPAGGPEDTFINNNNNNNNATIGYEGGGAVCLECQVALGVLQGQVEAGVEYEAMVEEAVLVCVEGVGYTPTFCQGFINLIGPILYHILSLSEVTPQDACGEMLTYLGCTSNDPRREWTVAIQGEKPPVLPLEPPEIGPDTLKVLHISDTHMDPLYLPGSLADCPEELCCRQESGQVADPAEGAWNWGDYRHCGSPSWLLEDMLQHARDTHPDLAYVMWTGDLVPHNMWSTSREWNLGVVQATNHMIQRFFPDIPVFPVVGNHEMSPLDAYPDPDDEEVEEELSADWLYAELTAQWSHLVPDLDNSTVRRAAYYSVQLYPGFRIISFNSMFGYSSNLWLVKNSTDPAGELSWLESELNTAESAGELVHLLGHVPPGIAAAERTWSREYNQIVNRYENIIRGQFFGHTHYDELQIFHDSGRPNGVAYITPSQTPWYDLNPAYRVYHIDGNRDQSTRLVLDHTTYTMNLTLAQETGTPQWFQLYSARDLYGMADLTPASWQDLVERMAVDRDLFDLYFRNYVSAGDPYLAAGCDDLCYHQRLCDLVTSNRNDLDACSEVIQLTKKDAAARVKSTP